MCFWFHDEYLGKVTRADGEENLVDGSRSGNVAIEDGKLSLEAATFCCGLGPKHS